MKVTQLAPHPVEDTVRIIRAHRAPNQSDDRRIDMPVALVVVGGMVLVAVILALCGLGALKMML